MKRLIRAGLFVLILLFILLIVTNWSILTISADAEGTLTASSYEELLDQITQAGLTPATIIITQDFHFDGVAIEIPAGSNITIKSEGNTTITLTQTKERHFNVKGSLTIENIVLTGSAPSEGGGVYVINTNTSRGSFTMNRGSVIQNCYNQNGGGVFVTYGSFTMNDGAVIRNCSAESGGGLYASQQCPVTINNGSIIQCAAICGGGVYLTGVNDTLVMDGNTIIQNCSATDTGGGLFVVGTTNKIYMGGNAAGPSKNGYPIISHNIAGFTGGGVSMSGNSQFTMYSGEISNNNTADNGRYAIGAGGIYVWYGKLLVKGGTICNNTSAKNGGGIYVTQNGTVDIMGGGSVRDNSAPNGDGGGIYTLDTNYANLTIDDSTIFEGNAASAYYLPSKNAQTLYPNILFASVSNNYSHPLNNYDINYKYITNNIIYYANDGTDSYYIGPDIQAGGTDTILSQEAAGFTREGYLFCGWNTSEDGSGMAYFESHVITLTNDQNLYAQWVVDMDVYTVLFDSNGGTNVEYQTIEYGGKVTQPIPPQRDDYTFVGWYTDNKIFEKKWNFDTDIVTSDITLFAKWYKTGGIQVVKTDEDNENNFLEGAVFKLYRLQDDSDNINEYYGGEESDGTIAWSIDSNKAFLFTTDAAGKLVINNLPYGTYYLEEIIAPEGYKFDKDKQTTRFEVNSEAIIEIRITNRRKTATQDVGGIRITKVNTQGKFLEGAIFKLYCILDEYGNDSGGYYCGAEADGTISWNSEWDEGLPIVTDVNGEIWIDNLPYGTYYLEEIVPPEGYKLPENPITEFTINDETLNGEQYIQLNIENTKIPYANFIFRKVDAEDITIQLPDAEFMLYTCMNSEPGHKHDAVVTNDLKNCNWEIIDSQVSDADGLVSFRDLIPGEYWLVEIKAPDGYQLPMGQWKVAVDNKGHIESLKAAGDTLPPAFQEAMDVEEEAEYLLVNIKSYQLPLSGSGGILSLTFVGIILIVCGIVLIFIVHGRYKRLAMNIMK